LNRQTREENKKLREPGALRGFVAHDQKLSIVLEKARVFSLQALT
jgi:hypothetical protein